MCRPKSCTCANRCIYHAAAVGEPPSWRLKRRKIRRWIYTALLISLRVEVGRETMGSVSPISCRLRHEDCVSFHLPPPTPLSPFPFFPPPAFLKSTIHPFDYSISSTLLECRYRMQTDTGFKVREWSTRKCWRATRIMRLSSMIVSFVYWSDNYRVGQYDNIFL